MHDRWPKACMLLSLVTAEDYGSFFLVYGSFKCTTVDDLFSKLDTSTEVEHFLCLNHFTCAVHVLNINFHVLSFKKSDSCC